MPKYDLREVLNKFNSKLSYKQFDRTALDISRSLAAGNLGDKDYATWATISDDPLVIVNIVRTFITTQVSKLSSAPYRPQNDGLAEMGINARLDSQFVETYMDVLNDGYAFVAVGIKDGQPVVKPIDSRYIMYNGDDPTLADATEILVFEIVPKVEGEELLDCSFLSTYVDFDAGSERVKVTHYHKDKDGKFWMDYYDTDPNKPTPYELPNVDRLPVIRFVGERIELADKRYHYRGIYYQMGSVMKAMALAATKIQTRTATQTDDNYIVRSDAIANHKEGWKNSGTREVDNVDSNGNDIPPVQILEHDNQFLINAFTLWKGVVGDMLGPTVASGSEAATREEVVARNEVKDAIANLYLSRMADSIEEVYRVINMLINGVKDKVVILGGFIESVHREKEKKELAGLYQLAKEGGMNTQGFVIQMLAIADLPKSTKEQLAESFQQDPFKSPQVLQLQATVQQLNKTIEQQNTQIALLRLQATQRLERQREFIDQTERTKRLEIAQKQWSEEQKQTQEAYMAILNDCLSKNDYDGAIKILNDIKAESTPLISDERINNALNLFADENAKSVESSLAETAQPPAPVSQPDNSIPFQQAVPHQQQAAKQTVNTTAPAPRPAVTTFNDA